MCVCVFRVCQRRRSRERECRTANGGRSQQEERGEWSGLNHESNSEKGKQAQVGVATAPPLSF